MRSGRGVNEKGAQAGSGRRRELVGLVAGLVSAPAHATPALPTMPTDAAGPVATAEDAPSAREPASVGAIARVLEVRSDPLSVLGLPPPLADARGRPSLACGEAAIHRAFRRTAATVHPDKHGGSEAAREAFEVVKDAHAALTNPARLEALLAAAAPAAAAARAAAVASGGGASGAGFLAAAASERAERARLAQEEAAQLAATVAAQQADLRARAAARAAAAERTAERESRGVDRQAPTPEEEEEEGGGGGKRGRAGGEDGEDEDDAATAAAAAARRARAAAARGTGRRRVGL